MHYMYMYVLYVYSTINKNWSESGLILQVKIRQKQKKKSHAQKGVQICKHIFWGFCHNSKISYDTLCSHLLFGITYFIYYKNKIVSMTMVRWLLLIILEYKYSYLNSLV